MHFLTKNQVVVRPAEAREQSQIGNIFSLHALNLPVVEELKVRFLRTPRIDVINQRLDVPISGALKENHPTQRKTGLRMFLIKVAALTDHRAVSDYAMAKRLSVLLA